MLREELTHARPGRDERPPNPLRLRLGERSPDLCECSILVAGRAERECLEHRALHGDDRIGGVDRLRQGGERCLGVARLEGEPGANRPHPG